MGHSPHRRWKGQLCKPQEFKDQGHGARQPWAVIRKIGKKRRLSRHDLSDFAEPHP